VASEVSGLQFPKVLFIHTEEVTTKGAYSGTQGYSDYVSMADSFYISTAH
jgi:hypothetical protein